MDDLVYQLAKAGGQLAVLVQDLSDVEGLGDSFKEQVHKLVCTIEDLERKLCYMEKWKHIAETDIPPITCEHEWELLYDEVKICSHCGRKVIGVIL